MKSHFVFACALSIFVGAVLSTQAAPPTVTFPTPSGPGIQIPAHTPTNENPVDYGLTGTNYGWAYDSFQGTSNAGDALFRMAPTLQGPGAFQAMGESLDWVFHMEFQHQGAYPSSGDFLMSARHAPADIGQTPDGREDRVFAVGYGTNANSWSILVGNNSGGWFTAVSGLSIVNEEYIDFDVHYKAVDDEMDLYWENALVATASTGHGRYDIDFLQVEDMQQTGITSIRNFRLGHIPEPAMLSVLGLGTLALRRRA